jgi:hypothetical protein
MGLYCDCNFSRLLFPYTPRLNLAAQIAAFIQEKNGCLSADNIACLYVAGRWQSY